MPPVPVVGSGGIASDDSTSDLTLEFPRCSTVCSASVPARQPLKVPLLPIPLNRYVVVPQGTRRGSVLVRPGAVRVSRRSGRHVRASEVLRRTPRPVFHRPGVLDDITISVGDLPPPGVRSTVNSCPGAWTAALYSYCVLSRTGVAEHARACCTQTDPRPAGWRSRSSRRTASCQALERGVVAEAFASLAGAEILANLRDTIGRTRRSEIDELDPVVVRVPDVGDVPDYPNFRRGSRWPSS